MAKAPLLTVRGKMGASHKYELGGLLQAHSLQHRQGSGERGQGADHGPGNTKPRKRLDLKQIFGDGASQSHRAVARVGDECGHSKKKHKISDVLQSHGLGRRTRVSQARNVEISADNFYDSNGG